MQKEMVATATARRMAKLIAMPMMAAVGRRVGLLCVVVELVVVVPDEEVGVWDAEGVN